MKTNRLHASTPSPAQPTPWPWFQSSWATWRGDNELLVNQP
nr:hypothetical protein [Pseudomonas chlororaphis]